MTTKTRMLAAISVLFAVVGLTLAACGGSDDDGESTEPEAGSAADAYAASETIDEFSARFEEAVAALQEGDCEVVNDFFAFAQLGLPCEQQVAADFEDFEITGSEDFDGIAAVIDFEAAAGPGTLIATLGNFELLEPAAVLPVGGTVGTEPADTEARQEDLQAMLDALAEQDCEPFFTYALTRGDDQEQECEFAFGPGSEREREELAMAVEAGIEPEPIGGNEFVTFYTLSTEDPASHRVLYTIPDDQDPHFISDSRRIGPPEEGVAEVDRSVAAGLVVELNTTIGPAEAKFLAEIEPVAADGDLEAMQSLSREFRDALFEFDARLRDLDLPDSAAEQRNAVFEAVGSLIAILDEVAATDDARQAATLTADAVREDEELAAAILELMTALGR